MPLATSDAWPSLASSLCGYAAVASRRVASRRRRGRRRRHQHRAVTNKLMPMSLSPPSAISMTQSREALDLLELL